MNPTLLAGTMGGIDTKLFALILLWTLPWTGVALWKAARLSHKKWFIALFLLNTLGILAIIYIFAVARKYTVETEESGVEEKNAEVK